MDLDELSERLEAVSARYASRFSITRSDDWFLLKLQEEIGELTQAHLMRAGQARRKNLSSEELDTSFREEVADVLAQVLLLARHHGIDVTSELTRKWFVWSDVSPRPEDVLPEER